MPGLWCKLVRDRKRRLVDMATKTHDYDRLKREFLASDISIRALCVKHDIKGFSTVAKYARDHGWYDERDAVQGRKRERMVERVADKLAEQEADEIEQFRSESLQVIRATLYKFAENLQNPEYRVQAQDLVKLLQLGLLITGQPTSRTEERRLDVVANFDGLPADVLRALASATRPQSAHRDAEGVPARAGASEPRPN